MKRVVVLILLVGLMMFAAIPAASAHVHVFTPLRCLDTDNANSGALVGFDKAADAAAPFNRPTGVIPRNASGKLPTGGQGADNACK